ncbi:hypothetical protein GA0116948_105259 [Chitinophaga costaii]|uniref:Uncharacterized protein n=1 Tax=Chitinophaga costaii TaxID=1335309 RepID=A0A1C4DG73_9BACT|nr:hypothetical protein [Chitinophaga costaii]PUZ24619.1 hypothetical protein DCM91_12055 [Chitinophaga costaii]SCC30385.1 hypothetical protein GA0116948_105259 [Chitinophaga costaii]
MLFTIALLLFPLRADTGYQTYCNNRFDFCVEYNASFQGAGESGNEDGQVFFSPDKKASLSAWGNLLLEDTDADPATDKVTMSYAASKAAKDLRTVTYKSVHDTWFILSGTDAKGNIVYEKKTLRKIAYLGDATPQTMVWHTFVYKYPAAQQAVYGGFCAKVAQFK